MRHEGLETEPEPQDEETSIRIGALKGKVSRLRPESKTMLFGCVVALILHILFFIKFTYFGVYPMAYYNIFSIAVFAFSIYYLVRTDETAFVICLAAVEVMLQQVPAVKLLGWGLGYQFYLLTIPVFAHLGNFRRRGIPQGLSALSCLALVWLLLHYRSESTPLYSLPPNITRLVFSIIS